MRAFSVFLDEQWLQAVSEKDMTVPAKFLASKLQAELPVQVQYVGLTKILFLFTFSKIRRDPQVKRFIISIFFLPSGHHGFYAPTFLLTFFLFSIIA